MTTNEHPLELRTEGSSGRYYLDGRPVHNGDVVEVELQDGQWLQLRLEGMPRDLQGYGLPQLAGGHELVAKVPAGASFRWPVR